jgi:hypothetical protein
VCNQQESKQKATIHLPVHKKDAIVCGAQPQDHQRVWSKICPWKGLLGKKEVPKHYEKTLKEMGMLE